jgi:dTDP-glucose 4,6-dehydratase
LKVAILGGGNVYALNLARHLADIGIDHFGIGRSPVKSAAMWQIEHHYRYRALHIVDQLPAYMAVLDQERPDVVVNFAAQGEGAASFGDDAHFYYQTNLVALTKLESQLRKRSYLQRFVQIGTSESGGIVDRPSKESDPFNPTSPYGISKTAFDRHLQVMHQVHGAKVNIVRPANAYCPGQQLHRIIPKAIICALKGEKFQLHGGGRSEKCYIHADDLSRGIVKVIEQGKLGEIYNCSSPYPISMRTLTEKIAEACEVRFDDLVDIAPERIGQDGRYWPDATKLHDLGWLPVVSLERGLRDMVRWVKAHPELLKADTTFRLRP